MADLNPRIASYLRTSAESVDARNYVDAVSMEQLALDAAQELGNPPAELAAIHGQRGERAFSQSDWATAESELVTALACYDKVGGASRERFDREHLLGLALARQGKDPQALAQFEHALAVGDQLIGRFYPGALTRIAMADVLRRSGRRAEAEQRLREAIALAEAVKPEGYGKIVEAALDGLRALTTRAVVTPPRSAAAAPAPAPAPPPPPDPAALTFDAAAYATVLAELNALVGMASAKAQFKRLAELLRINVLRRAEKLKIAPVSLHLIFVGGPGTGKTTLARLIGRLYHALGLLASDRVLEVTRADLVSGYVGQTATLTNQVVDRALDGVLFLDEAYSLVRAESSGDFGPEAVAELLKRMEDDRARLAVIVAGYPVEMDAFLESNSGFRSRFGEQITFADYGPAELAQIFETVFAAGADYRLDAPAREELARVCEALHATRDRYFANARTMRNLFEDVVAHQAERLLAAGEQPPDRDELMTLTAADVKAAAVTAASP